MKTRLVEDKQVKFNGQTYPKDGWCVIMCGGLGSGKSAAVKNKIPIDAKIFNVDDMKEFVAGDNGKKKAHGEIVDNELVFMGKHYSLDGISEPYDLTNKDYTSFLHQTLKPLTKKLKKKFFEMGIDAERKPNILFDMTGSEEADFETIIDNLQPYGYKFAVVWVFATFKDSLSRALSRKRQVDPEVVTKTYRDVIVTIDNMQRGSNFLKFVDEFWVIYPTEYTFNLSTSEGTYKYIKADNVMRLPVNGDVLEIPREISKQIQEQEDELINRYKDLIKPTDMGEVFF